MIYLMRHGEISSHGNARLVGQIDVPLSGNGLYQAEQWRDELSSMRFERICCSDLDRTRRTAEIIAQRQDRPVEALEVLREINLGEWDGIAKSRLDSQFPGEWAKRGADLPGYRPPRGESFSDLQARVVPVFHEIEQHAHSDVLIVAHAGVNRVILCHVLGMPLGNLFRIDQGFACLNIIRRTGSTLQLVAMNLSSLPRESQRADTR